MFPFSVSATTVRLETVLGNVDVQLYDSAAPLTVANFLAYVRTGAYNGSFVHRSVPGFVIQGGGYIWDDLSGSVKKISAGNSITNEFSRDRSNVRGTIAMAKVGSDPNSATCEWFINLADNAENLDNQNGGFAVFGQVVGNGMSIIDAIASLTTVNAGGVFAELPLASVPASGIIKKENLVMVTSLSVLPDKPDMDRVFEYFEVTYPHYLAPSNAISASAGEYYYRYYPDTNAYLGAAGGTMYYLGALFNNQLTSLGSFEGWLARAAAAGF